jgi:hypothetical protein
MMAALATAMAVAGGVGSDGFVALLRYLILFSSIIPIR